MLLAPVFLGRVRADVLELYCNVRITATCKNKLEAQQACVWQGRRDRLLARSKHSSALLSRTRPDVRPFTSNLRPVLVRPTPSTMMSRVTLAAPAAFATAPAASPSTMLTPPLRWKAPTSMPSASTCACAKNGSLDGYTLRLSVKAHVVPCTPKMQRKGCLMPFNSWWAQVCGVQELLWDTPVALPAHKRLQAG